MKLFTYYALHSLKNQIKKIFKTWVFIFIVVCIIFGGIIGVGVASLENMAESKNPDIASTEIEEEKEKDPAHTAEMIELIAGGVILAVFVYEALGADKNGSRIFLPADVNLLFASPMKPQSVLMFKLATQLGTAIFASIYLLFQVPNLVVNAGLGLWAALAIIITWGLTIIIGKLIQVLLYLLCSAKPAFKKNLRNGIIALLILIAASYYIYMKRSGLGNYEAAVGFFNSEVSRYIPLWGWLKGFLVYAAAENTGACLAYLAALVVGGAALVYFIRRTKADFYEDAMAKSEETAEMMERARADQSGRVAMKKRKKDRADGIKRDGMRFGSGANVFFFKTLYNRFRFAHFGFLTKTTETYIVAAVGVAALCRCILKTDGGIPLVLTLAGLSFFRALGNPLEQDTKMGYFVMIPESTWSKLFWSLLGSSANCLMDVFPALLLGALLLGENLLASLAWIPLIVSVDFFATTVGTFIALSVPVSAGKNIKQIVQIMFIYFGLLPDIAIMAVGIVMEWTEIAAVCASALNFALGLLFFSLSPLFIDHRDRRAKNAPIETAGDPTLAKKVFSRISIGVFVILLVASAIQLGVGAILSAGDSAWAERTWLMWLVTFAPIYLAAMPAGVLIIRRAPVNAIEKHSLGAGKYIVIAIICVFMMYGGNIVGTLATSALQAAFGVTAVNPVLSYAMDDSLIAKILVMVIIAPIAEEYIFRKLLIDRMNVYGEKLAVVTSALLFALFHGNLSQAFYAFALGLVFGYVYLKTGKLRYSIGLHMFINALGSVIAPYILGKVDMAALETADFTAPSSLETLAASGIGTFGIYVLVMLGLSVVGLVLLCIKSRNVCFSAARCELPKRERFKTVWLNVGMLLLAAGFVALTLSSLLM